MEKLLIIDGHNLLFQMFYGMPSRIVNADGKAIQGVLGFVGALLKIMTMIMPSYVVVLFDGEHENKRVELNSEYKTNRKDYSNVAEQENPFSQLDDIYKALEYLHIKYYEEDEYEVDDIIATYVMRYGNEIKITIVSFDSDFFQLISKNTSVLRYRGKKTVVCDSQYVYEKYGITPEHYADFKSMTGDYSDNIRGVDGIGPKTAMRLISEFGNLENVISHAGDIKRAMIRDSIIQNTDRLRTNYQIIKLSDVEKIPFSLAELLYANSGITTTEVLKGIGLK